VAIPTLQKSASGSYSSFLKLILWLFISSGQ
jgi:hypothetical protein